MPHVIDPKQKNKVPKKGSLHQRCTPYFVTSDDYTLFAESVQKLQPVQNDGGQRLFEQFKKKTGDGNPYQSDKGAENETKMSNFYRFLDLDTN